MFEVGGRGSKVKRIVMNDDPETLECMDPDSCDILLERFMALKDIFP